MAVEISDADFTVESTGEALPVSDPAPADAPAADPTPQPDTPEPADEPAEDVPAAEPQAAAGERNPDGTFKAKDKTPNRRDDPYRAVKAAVTAQRDTERRHREAEQRAEAAEARIRELEASRSPQPAAPAKETPAATWQRLKNLPDAPKSEQFETYEDFTFAAMAFTSERLLEEREQVASRRAQVAQFERVTQQRFSAYGERIDAAVKADPQFLDSLSSEVLALKPSASLARNEPRTVYNAIADEIIESEHPDALMRHLTAHPEEFQRLATLPPLQLTRQMAILESRVSDAAAVGSAPKAPVLSQAKPPIKPVGSAPPAVEDAGSDDEPVEMFIKRENAKLRRGSRQ